MNELDSYKIRRLILREMLVGVLNGVIFALLIGVVSWLRFFNPGLGLVIAVAMIVNMTVAGTSRYPHSARASTGSRSTPRWPRRCS